MTICCICGELLSGELPQMPEGFIGPPWSWTEISHGLCRRCCERRYGQYLQPGDLEPEQEDSH